MANGSVAIPIGNWGTNDLYVDAIDANGDISSIIYQFYAISPTATASGQGERD